MTGFKRHLKAKVKNLLTQFPAVAILGVRQCGKTTLARTIGQKWRYVDLENPRDFDQLSDDPAFYFTQYPNAVILDEAQAYPPLFSTLRGVIDAHRHKKGRFLITGSSQPDLLNHISETLAGRVASIRLSPLKTSEYARRELGPFFAIFEQPLSKKAVHIKWPIFKSADYHTLWLKGGFPEPLTTPTMHSEWMGQFYDQYIYRDIGRLFPKLDKVKFRRFVQLLGALSGTVLNKSKIGQAIECNESTIRDYLEIADGTFVWRLLPSYEKSDQKSIVKMPKGYLRDSGMLHNLLGIQTHDQLLNHPAVGKSFESFIIEELLRGIDATSATQTVAYYYRTRNGAEVDLIIEGSFGTLPIEIKHGTSLDKRKIANLTHFIKDQKLEFGILITQHPEIQWLTPEVLHLPMGCL